MTLSEFYPAWYEGSALSGGTTTADVPRIYQVAIAGHGYMIEPSLYRRTLVPVQRDARDESTEPGEQNLSPSGVWRRSQSDWSLGAGQTWLDEEDSSRRRFFRSKGVDTFSNQFQATLHHLTQEKRSSANTNLKLVSASTRLYYADGAQVAFSDAVDSETNAAWTTNWTTATGLPGGNVLDMVFWGSHVIVLGSDNSIYGATVGTTAFTLLYNPVAALTRIWVGLGRLFGSANNGILYEITNLFGGGAEATVFTHPNTNFRINSLIGTPTGIYFGGSLGANGEIRYTKVNAAGSGFDAPFVTAEFVGEEVLCMASAGANLIIGTTLGFRYSSLDQNAAGLNFGPVVTTPGAVREMTVDNVDAETFVWFTWSNIYGEGDSGLGRIRPRFFAEAGVPAYMSDIYADGSSGSVLTVASIRGKRYFGISTDGFYGETDNFVPEGILEVGRIRYGILDTKVFTDLQWRSLSLPAEAEISAEMTMASGQIVTTGSQVDDLSTESPSFNLGPAFSEWSTLDFILLRGGVITSALLSESTGSATTPDIAAYAVTDLDVRVRVSLPSWTPGGFGRVFADQWGGAGNQGWLVGIDATGHLALTWSNDGTATNTILSTSVVPWLGGSIQWIRYSLDVNNGAGGKVGTFYVSSDGVSWSVFETITQGGTTTIFNSTASLRIGGLITGVDMLVLQMQLMDSIGGTAVANPNVEIQEPGTTSFADAAGRTWTVNAPATIILVPGSDASAPTLTSWVLRAIPSPTTTTQFLVPILLRQKLVANHGPDIGVAGEDELEFLSSLVASQAIVKYQEGRRAYDVHVVNFEVQGVLWDKTAETLETTVLVQLYTLR